MSESVSIHLGGNPLIGLMIRLGSICWNFCHGLDTNNVARHDQGMKIMSELASNLALVLKKLKKAGNMQLADLVFVYPAKVCLTC